MRTRRIGSARIAKFGVFKPCGDADVLLTARDSTGKPLMTYADAMSRVNDYPDERPHLLVRSL